MPAFLERLDKYDDLTEREKKIFRGLVTDFLPYGVDYKFHCEPLTFDLPENFIGLWQKYPENPAPQEKPIDSFNKWRSKIADELSLEKIGYLPPEERLARYGSIDGKLFRTLLMDIQALSSEEFEGIDFEIPQRFIDIWKNHPENFAPNSDSMKTLTEYCKKINDEIRNPNKYINPENKPILTELSEQKKEALKIAPPIMEYPNHSFINTASFDYSLIKTRQDEFSQRSETPTLKDYALVRATNNFPINGYHVPINQDTRISKSKSFLGPDIASFEYSEMKNFAVNGLTEFPGWDDKTFNIIEPLAEHINNPNLIALHPRRYYF